MARVIGIERHIGRHSGGRGEDLNLADLQTIRIIISISLKVERDCETHRQAAGSIVIRDEFWK